MLSRTNNFELWTISSHSSRRRVIRDALESGSQSNLSIVRRWLLEIKRHCLRVNSSWLSMTNVSRQPRWVPRGWIEGVQKSWLEWRSAAEEGRGQKGREGTPKTAETKKKCPPPRERALTSIINNTYRRWRENKKELGESRSLDSASLAIDTGKWC